MIKNYIIILLIVLLIVLLQGCFVVGIGNKPMWKSRMIYNGKDSLETEINISKPNFIIPLPFMLFEFDKKEYALNLYVLTKQNDLNLKIDSVLYTIFDSNNNLVSVAPIIQFGDNFNMRIDTANSYYNIWATTAPIIKVPKKMHGGNLTIDYKIYFRGQSAPLKGSKTLELSKPKWIWIGSFY